MTVFKVRTPLTTIRGQYIASADVYVAAKNKADALWLLCRWSIDVSPKRLARVSSARSNMEISRLAREESVIWKAPNKTGVHAAHDHLPLRSAAACQLPKRKR